MNRYIFFRKVSLIITDGGYTHGVSYGGGVTLHIRSRETGDSNPTGMPERAKDIVSAQDGIIDYPLIITAVNSSRRYSKPIFIKSRREVRGYPKYTPEPVVYSY